MSKIWNIYIYNQPTVVRATVHELEYHGEWMADEYVSVTVRAAAPVTFHYGDHLFYRGTKFEINYDPNFIKKARRDTYGDGFVYDNIRFYPIAARLKDVAFKDVVLNSVYDAANKLVYSSLGTFPFFAASVEDLADRILANLNRDYSGQWLVFTPNKARSIQRNGQQSQWTNYYNGDGTGIQGRTDVNIECQNLSVFDALKLAYTSFDLSFYVKGQHIVIGGKPIVADYDFEYGKGNGLYEIERTHDESQRIVTKLYAYGSDRNLPLNYYANIGKKVKVPIYYKNKREIIQGNPQLLMWVNQEWTKKLADAFGPTYEVKLTAGGYSARFGVDGDTYTYADEQDDSTFDHTTKYMFFWTLNDRTEARAFWNAVSAGSSVYVTGVNINQMPNSFIEMPQSYSYDAALSITRLMLPGFPLQSLYDWVMAHGGTSIEASTGKALWKTYRAYFSKDASDPWIKSLNADDIGVREGTVEFDSSAEKEIYPTIEGTGFDVVQEAEQVTDNGHVDGEDLTFELIPAKVNGSDGDIEWDYCDDTVSISMKDGYCVGREFKVNNAKYEDGSWILDLERQKDDGVGAYFPNKHDNSGLYQVSAGDHFVVLGIPLPQSYVDLSAATLLEEALKELKKIDHQTYTYLPKIDEIEMQRQDDLAAASQGAITSIHDTICAGMQMQIDDDDLDVHYSPFIDTITIKENGNNGIPTYDVVLKDEKEMTMQERIQSQIQGGRDAVIEGLPTGDGEFLSRVSDDTAKGLITFLRGLQVGERFVTGLLGEGGIFRVEDDGTTYIEADKLYIRMKAYFDSVEIREYHHTAGNRIASCAGARCCRVEWIDSNGDVLEKTQENLSSVVKFRCYFRGSDGEDEVRNNFVVGDLAYCHVTTVATENDNIAAKGLNLKHYWRKVVGRNTQGTLTVEGEHWIDLSNVTGEFQSGSDIPEAQDDIVQLGNVSDTTRQGAIIEFVTGADAPSYQIFQGIHSFDLTGKNYVRFGYDSSSGGAQAFIGNPDGSTYLWYHRVTEGGVTFPRLDIKANVKFTSPITHQETNIEDFAGAVTNSIEDLQEQIDGEIDTWFYEGTPTLNNAPANEWTTATEKERHLGDLYYDIGTGATGGFAYRFIKDENNVYQWQYLEDTAITEALAKAAEAYDLADHKRRVFYTTPTPPYDNGDLWVNAVWPASGASQGETYNDDILRCVTSKSATGTFSISDWTLASNYTDDSALVDFVTNTYAQDLENLETQIDGKAETWYQDSDPSTAWTDTDTKVAHVGDIWYDTSANGGKKTYIWRDRGEGQSNRFYWAEQAVPDDVFDEIDGKAAVYVAWNAWVVDGVSQLNVRDLFIPSSDTTQGGVAYKANKVYRCINASTPTFQEIHYTDDTTVDYIINSYGNILGISSPTAQNVGEALGFLRQVLGGSTSVDGGLVLTNLIAMKDAASTPNIWGGISGMYKTAETGTTWKGYGIAAWYGGAMVDKECLNATQISQGWNTHRWARSLFRFDGSGYVADGNISWDKSGTPTIKGYVIDTETLKIGGNTVNLSDYVTIATDQTITGLKTFNSKIKIGDVYLEWESANNALKVYKMSGNSVAAVNLYATGGVSALGIGSGGGGGDSVTLNEPLNSINTAGLSLPSSAGATLVYNGTTWTYSTLTTLQAMNLTVYGNATFASSLTANGITINGKDNTYVVLAGGGTKLLSEIGGGSGSVNSITIGNSSTQYTPDANGNVNIPAYPSNYVTGIAVNNGSPISPTGGIVSLTIPTKVSDLTNDSGFITTDTKNTAGATNNTAIALYLVGAPSQTANPETYTRTGCYISSDGYLYSGGSKVLTSVGNVVTTIALNNSTYQPQSGVVSLPPYPSKTSDLTNDSGFITGYTDTKNTAGATDNVNTKLFLIGSTAQGANPQTYSNQSCYIGTDNCLYSGGSKVMTAASGYLPLTGGTLTGQLKVNDVIFGYNFANSYNAPAFVFDKYGDYYTGIGANGTADTIFFGTVNVSDFSWNTSYKQKWLFNGTVTADSFTGGSNNFINNDNEFNFVPSAYSDVVYFNYRTAGGYNGNITEYRFCDGKRNNFLNILKEDNNTRIEQKEGSNILYVGHNNNQGWVALQDVRSQIGDTYWNITTNGYGTFSKIIKVGGTSSQFLKADGSVDSTSYATSDTKNTAGATDIYGANQRLYIIGAPTQTANPETFTHRNCYISSDGYLYSGGSKVLTSSSGLVTGISVDNSTPYEPTNGIVGLPVLRLSGGTLTGQLKVNDVIFGHNYTNNQNAPAFVFDKLGNNYTGIGANGTSDTIFFGAVTASNFSWDTSYLQKWVFNGAIKGGGDSGIYVGGNYTGDATVGFDCIERSGSGNAMHLQFFNSGNVTICKGGGNVGIGLSRPSYKLDVSGTLHASGDVNLDGKTFIGSGMSGNYKLLVNGSIICTSLTQTSDVRNKDIIADKTIELWQVAQAPIFTFKWIDKELGYDTHVGTSAQYWKSIVPEAVQQSGNGYLGMQYDVVALLAAVTTAKKVQDHEMRIQALERENEALKNELSRLKAA